MAIDVVVVGGGPAGWAVAAAVANVGLAVTLVAPIATEPWPSLYGAWVDELDGLGLGSPWRGTWPAPVVVGEHRHELSRPYGLFDNAALAAALRSQVEAAGGHARAGWVVGANHDRWQSSVVLADGGIVSGRVVIDASGADAALVQRPARPRPAFQVTHGAVVRRAAESSGTGGSGGARGPGSGGSSGDGRECVLIDLSDGPDTDADPTFVTALELGDGAVVAAETSLVRRPELPADVARHRLEARLAAWGVAATDVATTETACEPVLLARPPMTQREVGFGAAAARVHPLAGLGSTLRTAPALARAVADALVGRRATPSAAARAGWDAVWPPARRRAASVDRQALEVVARLNRGGQRRFIDALFSLDQEQWSRYVAGTMSAGDIRALLAAAFRGEGRRPALTRASRRS